jgi:hypothetical protein
MLSKEGRAMENEAAGPAPGKMPYEAALIEVIKGLRGDPVLLFGIGAGIVAVGAIAVTSSLPLVLVVAGIFVVVLLARTHQRARRVQGGDISVSLFGSSIRNSDIATGLEGGSRFRGRFFGSRVTNSRIGTGAGTSARRPPED